MTGAYWKDRFSEKQLERKRLSDKISQRRTRQLSKRNIAEFESRICLLRSGQTATLINRIQQENALLRTKIWRYRAQMESMFMQGKECLQQDDPAWGELNAAILTRPSPPQDTANNATTPSSGVDRSTDDSVRRSAEKRSSSNMILSKKSLFVELAGLLGRQGISPEELAVNEILESIMMWKAKFGVLQNEFAALIAAFEFDREPFSLTPDKVQEQAMSKYLFHDIVQNILYGEELCPRDLRPEDKISEKDMSRKQLQRRAIAYCAYETMRTWRGCFKTSLEYLAMFWAHYRFFLLIAFPTLENYHKCPAWRRPVAKQFDHEHPSVIDLIICVTGQKFAKNFVDTWQDYELPRLCISIVRSLEFKGSPTDVALAVSLQSDSSDVVLDMGFEEQIHDIRNFATDSWLYTTDYPELAAVLTAEHILFPHLEDPHYNLFNLMSSQNERAAHWFQTQDLLLPSPLIDSHDFLEVQGEEISGMEKACNSSVPGLSAGAPSATEGSIDWWTDSLTDQSLQALFVDLGDKFARPFVTSPLSTQTAHGVFVHDGQDHALNAGATS